MPANEDQPLPRKKPSDPPAEEGGAPEWMVTFADLVTLLLCFFILLLSFAEQDIEKFRDMLGSVRDAFGVQKERKEYVHTAFSPSAYERKGVKLDGEQKKQLALAVDIKNLVRETPEIRNQVSVSAEADGVLFRVKGRALFKPGSTEFSPEAQKVLGVVINVLKQHNYDLIVEGHTDDTPVRSERFPSNWELSSARAAAALRYIMKAGDIPVTRLKAVGYASSRPLVPNDTPANRELNRRVEFFYRPPSKARF